jgi:hypothetical protein
LIATFKTKGEALAVSKPLDRDRAVDEGGNQIAVFGRRGARPFTFEETQRILRTNGGKGEYFQVADEPTGQPQKYTSATESNSKQVVGVLLLVLVAASALGSAQRFRSQGPQR